MIGEDARQRLDVPKPGHVVERQRVVGQQGGDHQRQRRVLGAGDGDDAVQLCAAGDADAVHARLSLVGRPAKGRAPGKFSVLAIRLGVRVVRRGPLAFRLRPVVPVRRASARLRLAALQILAQGRRQALGLRCAVMSGHRNVFSGEAWRACIANTSTRAIAQVFPACFMVPSWARLSGFPLRPMIFGPDEAAPCQFQALHQKQHPPPNFSHAEKRPSTSLLPAADPAKSLP